MRQRRIGKEPEYRRQQQAAAERRQEAENQENVITSIITLNASINRVAAEHAASREQAERHETQKRDRDWATVGALIAAAVAALITVIVSHRDNRAIIRGAEDTAKRQLRAYVFFDRLEMTGINNPDGPKTFVRIKKRRRNARL